MIHSFEYIEIIFFIRLRLFLFHFPLQALINVVFITTKKLNSTKLKDKVVFMKLDLDFTVEKPVIHGHCLKQFNHGSVDV